MTKLKTTEDIKLAKIELDTLERILPSIISQPFWKKQISSKEKIIFIKEMANVRTSLSIRVNKEYPQLIGKAYIVSNDFIEYKDEKPLDQEEKEKE